MSQLSIPRSRWIQNIDGRTKPSSIEYDKERKKGEEVGVRDPSEHPACHDYRYGSFVLFWQSYLTCLRQYGRFCALLV
jgi:hypothetical protein